MYFSVPKIVLILANNEAPDEMPQSVAFHLGLHCLPKYPFMVSQLIRVGLGYRVMAKTMITLIQG